MISFTAPVKYRCFSLYRQYQFFLIFGISPVFYTFFHLNLVILRFAFLSITIYVRVISLTVDKGLSVLLCNSVKKRNANKDSLTYTLYIAKRRNGTFSDNAVGARCGGVFYLTPFFRRRRISFLLTNVENGDINMISKRYKKQRGVTAKFKGFSRLLSYFVHHLSTHFLSRGQKSRASAPLLLRRHLKLYWQTNGGAVR